MNKDQGTGIFERVIYGAIMYVVVKYGAHFGLTNEDAAWIAAGGVTLFFSVIAWVRNRPVSILNRAADALPDNTKLVMRSAINATDNQKAEVFTLGENTGPKVSAQTSL